LSTASAVADTFSFRLNGRVERVAGVEPHLSLLAYLRSRGLTGAKEVCGEGECGACAVSWVAADASGQARFETVAGCLVSVPEAAGRDIWTVEGIGSVAAPHPVQAAVAAAGGSQCGYCTPGFCMTLFSEYYRPDRAAFDPSVLAGNLCRCGAYGPLCDAARGLGRPAAEDPILALTPPPLPAVDYGAAGCRFVRPRDLEGVFAALRTEPRARLLAGGTDVGADMQARHARWPLLVSLTAARELRGWTTTPDALEIGAGLSLREVQERLAGSDPAFDELCRAFGSPLVRARATLGGNVCGGSPVADAAVLLLALDAEALLRDARGERRLPLARFFVGPRRTALAPGEVLVALRLPRPAPRVQRLLKASRRALDDVALVTAAFALDLDGDGRVERARLAFGGVAPVPMRVPAAEDALIGRALDADAEREVAALLRAALSPVDDLRASAAYRAALVEGLWCLFRRAHGAPA
jgi:xanthine dehydrogenase small subunit